MKLSLFLHWNGSKAASEVEIVYGCNNNYKTFFTHRPVEEVEQVFHVDLHRTSIISTSYEAVEDGRYVRLPFGASRCSTSNGIIEKCYFL